MFRNSCLLIAVIAVSTQSSLSSQAETVPNVHENSCGSRCVAFVLDTYKVRRPTLEKLVEEIQGSFDQPARFDRLRDALEHRGISCGFVTLDPFQCTLSKHPFIIHESGNHFAVATAIDRSTLLIHDGNGKPQEMDWAAIRLHMSDTILLTSPTDGRVEVEYFKPAERYGYYTAAISLLFLPILAARTLYRHSRSRWPVQ